jgi:hypothetical protein
MDTIKITSGLNYQVKLPEGIYYPATIFTQRNGYTEIMFYFPNQQEKNLFLKSRCLKTKYLNHLSFSEGDNEKPKIFIHKGLASLLWEYAPLQVSTSDIKNADEINNFQKYFDILK